MEQKDVNVLRHEFIGKRLSVKETGVKGKVIDETKNSFVLLTRKGKRRVIKQGRTFVLQMVGDAVEIQGKSIALRPEDRIKIKKWK